MPRFWLNVEPEQIEGGILLSQSFEVASNQTLFGPLIFTSGFLGCPSSRNIRIIWNALIVVVFLTGSNFAVCWRFAARWRRTRICPTFASFSYRWWLLYCALWLISIRKCIFEKRARSLTFITVFDPRLLPTYSAWFRVFWRLFSSRRIFTF